MTRPHPNSPADSSVAHGRRGFMVAASSVAAGAVAGCAMPGSSGGSSGGADSEAITYEVRHTEAQWRARLTDVEYQILRTGRTEQPKSSPFWNSTAKGRYRCKGCDLTNYDARWKVVLDKGWVFFRHSEPSTVLTGIEGPVPEYGAPDAEFGAFIEVHCRRCGSHLGHLLQMEDKLLHCINGASLKFRPEVVWGRASKPVDSCVWPARGSCAGHPGRCHI